MDRKIYFIINFKSGAQLDFIATEPARWTNK